MDRSYPKANLSAVLLNTATEVYDLTVVVGFEEVSGPDISCIIRFLTTSFVLTRVQTFTGMRNKVKE